MTDTEAEPVEAPAKPRRRRLIIVLGVVLAAGVVALLLVPSGDAGDTTPGLAPAIELPAVVDRDATVSLQEYRGTPVVVNFWASWCVPCRKEMPALQAVAERFDGEVAFLGINHQDGRGAAGDLLAEVKVTYPSGWDPAGKVAQSLGVFGMPTTVFISAEGRVLKKRSGELSETELRETIRELFGVAGA